MEAHYASALESPIGPLLVLADEDALLGIRTAQTGKAEAALPQSYLTRRAVLELQQYFAKERFSFDLPLRLCGTPFQEKVWRALAELPYGETTSYAAIARRIGSPKAVRAVGGAVGRNPFLVVLPCHRVLTSDGRLGGFALGLEAKRTLLRLENIPWRE